MVCFLTRGMAVKVGHERHLGYLETVQEALERETEDLT